MILADTSVWITHLRHDSSDLRVLLDADLIHCHPFVIGELACGTLRRRNEVLALLERLPLLPLVSHEEALKFVQGRRLSGRGLGWIDIHLLASVVVASAQLWTLDKRLAAVASSLRVTM